MAATNNRRIVSMTDADLTPADPAEDVRGRTVVDANGDDIGDIEDLMLDQDESKVRFLQVGAGGFLGIGEKKLLIPVDAITRIDEDHVYVDRTREHIAGGPNYDPTLVRDDTTSDIWANTYSYYGYGPFWAPGYVSPAFPYYETGGPGRPDAPLAHVTDGDVGPGANPGGSGGAQRHTHDWCRRLGVAAPVPSAGQFPCMEGWTASHVPPYDDAGSPQLEQRAGAGERRRPAGKDR